MAWSSGYSGHLLFRGPFRTRPWQSYRLGDHRSVGVCNALRASEIFALGHTASGCAQRGYAAARTGVYFSID